VVSQFPFNELPGTTSPRVFGALESDFRILKIFTIRIFDPLSGIFAGEWHLSRNSS
jgi:hypothetical protein